MSSTEFHSVGKSFWPCTLSYEKPLKRSKEPYVSHTVGQTKPNLQPSQTSGRSYIQRVKELSLHFPHLQNCLMPSRFSHQKYSVFDYENHVLLNTRVHETDSTQPYDPQKSHTAFQNLVKDCVPSNLTHRVLVVEGLSSNLIELLGSELGIAPEFFEQHLINSGWQNGEYNDCEASSWNTRTLTRPFTSIKWLRSGISNFPRQLSAQTQRELLQPSGRLSWDESVVVTNGNKGLSLWEIRHEVTPAENIFRPSWQVKTRECGKESLEAQPVIWEERATFCVKQEAQHKIGMYLSCLFQ